MSDFFPSSPSPGQTYTASDGTVWTWDGLSWTSSGFGAAGVAGGISNVQVSSGTTTVSANGLNFVNSASVLVTVASGVSGNANLSFDAIGLVGAQGFQGRQGVQGAIGPQGFQGFQGVQGSIGNQGFQGFQGRQGVQGATGPQGFQGFQGVIGVQGSQGFQGRQGVQGAIGNQGAQGFQGFQGVQGVIGPQGFQGFQGVIGVQGSQGFQGRQGVQGSIGNQGFQGFQGSQGIIGAQGFQGFQGVQGATGTGSQGVAGAQGVQGASGSASAAGSTTQIQYNDGGAFDANANLTFDKTASTLSVRGNVELNQIVDGVSGSTLKLTRNSTQYGILRNYGSLGQEIISYSAINNAKPINYDSRTTVDADPFSSGSLGHTFRVNNAIAFSISQTLNDVARTSIVTPTTVSINSVEDALRVTQRGSGNAFVVEDSTSPDPSPFVIDAAGDVGIGTDTSSQFKLYVADNSVNSTTLAEYGILGNITASPTSGSTTKSAIAAQAVVTDWGTSSGTAIGIYPYVSARANMASGQLRGIYVYGDVTIPGGGNVIDYRGVNVSAPGLSAGNTITNFYGFFVPNSTANNNYSFYTTQAAGATNWGFYGSGTANNYLAGSLGLGTTVGLDTYKLNVTGDSKITGNVVIENNSAFYALRITQTGTGNAFVVEDSTNPDSTPFIINAAGEVGIGISACSDIKLYVSDSVSSTTATEHGIFSTISTTAASGSSSKFAIVGRAVVNDWGTSTGQATGVYGYGAARANMVSGRIRAFNAYGDVLIPGGGNVSDMDLYFATNAGVSAGNTITNLSGFRTADLTTGNNNFSFFTAMTAGANKWGFYASSTANNYFAGSLGIGATTELDTYKLKVTGNTFLNGRTFLGSTLVRDWSATDTDIDALIPGSTFGSLIEGDAAAHTVIGIPGNDSNDGFYVIDKLNDNAGTYKQVLLAVSNTAFEYKNSNTSRFVIDATGEVGIGVVNPLAKLHVRGSLGFPDTDTGILVNSNVSSDSDATINYFKTSANVDSGLFLTELNHFIATEDSFNTSEVVYQYGFYALGLDQALQNYGFYSQINSGADNWNFYATTAANNYFAGSLGLGTNGDTELNTYRLKVGGKTLLNDDVIINNSGTGNALRITQTGTGNAFVVEDSTSTDSTPFIINATGNVGIGTTAPTTTLDVSGNVRIFGTGPVLLTLEADTDNVNENDNPRIVFKQDGGAVPARVGFADNTNSFEVVNESVGYLRFGTTNAERMRIDSSGNVGIGFGAVTEATQFSYKLDVVGDARTTGNVTITDPTNAVSTGKTIRVVNGSYDIGLQARAAGGSYNPSVVANDSIIFSTAPSQGNGSLVLTTWSNVYSGIRIKATNQSTNIEIAAVNTTFNIDNSSFEDKFLSRAMTRDIGSVYVDKGTQTTGTITFDYTGGSLQRLQVGGSLTIAFSNFPPTANMGIIQIELVNGGSATVTFPTINWVKKDGTFTTSVSTYLTDFGRASLQSSGTDFFIVWTRDAGTTLYGKFL